jgi:hypothetical protein
MRHPDAALAGRREQGLGRRAGVRRAMVPEDSQAGIGVIGAGIVDMQRAPVAQVKISLCHHRGLLRAAGGVSLASGHAELNAAAAAICDRSTAACDGQGQAAACSAMRGRLVAYRKTDDSMTDLDRMCPICQSGSGIWL